jgi:hypothetical protein
MVSDAHQLAHCARRYTIVGRIIDDMLKKMIDLIFVVSSRFGIGKLVSGKKIPDSGSSCRPPIDLADR